MPHARLLPARRIALELLAATALGGALALLGAYVGILADVLGGREAGLGLGVGLCVGASLGMSVSVWGTGVLLRSSGSYGWAVAGSAFGAALGVVALGVRGTLATLVVSALLPVTGAVIGYELSSRRASRAL